MYLNSTALEMHVAVAILRVPEGLDYSGILAEFDNDEVVHKQPDLHNTAVKGVDNPAFVSDNLCPSSGPFSTKDKDSMLT